MPSLNAAVAYRRDDAEDRGALRALTHLERLNVEVYRVRIMKLL